MQDMGMAEDTMQGAAKPDAGGDDEAVSVFLPKSAFGDRPPKVGDSLSDFKIVDIDPESGEAEAKCSYDDKESGDKMGYEQAFNKAMPEEG